LNTFYFGDTIKVATPLLLDTERRGYHMEGYNTVQLKELIVDEGSVTNIFVSGNCIYILGNISIEDSLLEKELNDIKDEMFSEGKDLINVVYSSGMESYYITKPGSEAETLLDFDVTGF
jgi:hypothetical protein